MSKKKKKSVIASLDLKNYKPKYTDPYGDGTARPVVDEELTVEEAPEPSPIVEPPKVEPPKPKPEKIIPPEPPPPPAIVDKPTPSVEPPPAPPESPPKEKFEDIVRRIERNKKKARAVVDERPVNRPDENVEQKNPPRRVESYGIVISAISLVYAFYVADKAAFFLSMSLLSFLIRPLVGPLFGKHDHAVQNILKGFGIAVFVGAIIFIFY